MPATLHARGREQKGASIREKRKRMSNGEEESKNRPRRKRGKTQSHTARVAMRREQLGNGRRRVEWKVIRPHMDGL